MSFITVEQALVVLSALAGAAHVLAPDHWMPASLLAWQRRWGLFKILGFSLLAFTLHVATGFLIFLAGGSLFKELPSQDLFVFSVVLVGGVTLVRAIRFTQMKEIHRTASRNRWAIFGVLSLLGPCESVIPVFIKAQHLGVGYALPFIAFLAGTAVAGTASVIFGRFAWNRPFWLPRGLEIANQKMAAIPVVALVAVGLSFLFRLSV